LMIEQQTLVNRTSPFSNGRALEEEVERVCITSLLRRRLVDPVYVLQECSRQFRQLRHMYLLLFH
jgi:hypothetical protein